jgi:hypothetical protein
VADPFFDFQKALNSVDREVIWKLMHHYRFPPSSNSFMKMLSAR